MTAKEEILENMAKYSSGGSNWKVSNILKIDINMINYNPLKAGSYIPLDKMLADKKAIINIQNEGNECFKWCVTRALNMRNNHQERIDKELIEKSKEFNWEGIEFLVIFRSGQIAKFEENNEDISVNVYGYENGLYPLRASKYLNRKHKIDLLLISLDADAECSTLDAGAECTISELNSHYCLIKNFSRLASSQTSAHQHKTYYCRNCLQGYNSEEALSNNWTYCNEHSCVRIELPKKDSFMRFDHIERSMIVPFVVHADFESFIKPINTCDPDE